jgi:hypothetical protein
MLSYYMATLNQWTMFGCVNSIAITSKHASHDIRGCETVERSL